jgi:hypothetical protein
MADILIGLTQLEQQICAYQEGRISREALAQWAFDNSTGSPPYLECRIELAALVFFLEQLYEEGFCSAFCSSQTDFYQVVEFR